VLRHQLGIHGERSLGQRDSKSWQSNLKINLCAEVQLVLYTGCKSHVTCPVTEGASYVKSVEVFRNTLNLFPLLLCCALLELWQPTPPTTASAMVNELFGELVEEVDVVLDLVFALVDAESLLLSISGLVDMNVRPMLWKIPESGRAAMDGKQCSQYW
jgi:hypothetical protein